MNETHNKIRFRSQTWQVIYSSFSWQIKKTRKNNIQPPDKQGFLQIKNITIILRRIF